MGVWCGGVGGDIKWVYGGGGGGGDIMWAYGVEVWVETSSGCMVGRCGWRHQVGVWCGGVGGDIKWVYGGGGVGGDIKLAYGCGGVGGDIKQGWGGGRVEMKGRRVCNPKLICAQLHVQHLDQGRNHEI